MSSHGDINFFSKREEELEATKTFLESYAGKEYIERRSMAEEDINRFRLEDYSPASTPPGSISPGYASDNELSNGGINSIGTNVNQNNEERDNVKRRIRFAHTMQSTLGYKRAWALAFKKYPKINTEPNIFPHDINYANELAVKRYKRWKSQGATQICKNILNDYPEIKDLI